MLFRAAGVAGAVGLPRGSSGFSLIEVIVAAGLLAAATISLGGLLAMAVAANAAGTDVTHAATLAEQKVEQLRAAAWGAEELSPSPPHAAEESVAGWVEFFDRWGNRLPGGPPAPRGAAYVRRWAIEPLPFDQAGGVAIRVFASRVGLESRGVRLTAVRTRRAP